MTSPVLQTKQLTKTFGRRTAVDSIDITAYEGEVFGFLGPNGAGKTTTLGMALGLIHPTSGEVTVLGERVTPDRTQVLKQVGALLGAPAFVPYLTAWENVALVARLSPGIKAQRIEETLELVGLHDSIYRRVGKFSTGMKQRVGLAMALVHQPRFVILDEPTNGLDPAGMREIRVLLRSLVANGTTVLLSSHLLNEVEQVCDRIAVLNKGKVVVQGLVSELLAAQKPAVRLKLPAACDPTHALHDLPGVEELQTDGAWTIVSGVETQAVMSHLLRQNIIPQEIAAHKTDLESLFMEVTA